MMTPLGKTITCLVVAAALGTGGYYYSQRDQDPKGIREVLGDGEPGSRWFYDDWDAAKGAATREGKPIFALFRCVP